MDKTINTSGAVRKAPTRVPFAASCKARAIPQVTAYAQCQSEASEGCRYRWPFNGGHLCQHPQNQKIVARTNALANEGGHE